MKMASDAVGNFFYFAYGTYVDVSVMNQALAAVSGSAAPAILRSHPAVLPGYRLTCDAVSVEGPRLGCLNIAPYHLVSRNPTSKHACHAKHTSPHAATIETLTFTAAFRDGVRGMLYELPASARAPLLQAVAREGSFNMYAVLPCYELNDVRHGVRDADAAVHEALVVAALDLPLLEHKYLVEDTMKLRWMALPPPLGVTAPVGLMSTAAAAASLDNAQAHANDEANQNSSTAMTTAASGTTVATTFRWPGLHWCNCINSLRVAPSCAYAAAIKKAYTTYLLLQTATEEEEEGQEKRAPHRANDTDDHEGAARDCASYGQTIYRMVYLRARDVVTDPMEQKTWYLAYGSNLSWEQVCLRIGPPYQRRAVKLPNYVLVPNKTPLDQEKYASFGYYNVEPVEMRAEKAAKGLVRHHSTMPPFVCGAAYEISEAQLAMMDHYEKGYNRQLLRCTDLHDAAAAPWDCWTYIAQKTSEDLLPSREYLSRVLEGADILPLEYMESIRATPTNPLRSPRQDQRLRKEI